MATEPLTIEQLERWVLSGAHWRAVEVSNGRTVVDLYECTGAFVERRESDDPAVISYLGAVRSDLDLG